VEANQLAVISWILPQTEATKADHRKETTYPSERWARSRVFGEEFNDALRKHVAARLSEEGFPAIAPCSPLLEDDEIGALRLRLHLVGKACRLRLGVRHLRPE